MFHLIEKKSFNNLFLKLFLHLVPMIIIPIIFLTVCFHYLYFHYYINSISDKYNTKLKTISNSIVSNFSNIEQDVLLDLTHPVFYNYKRMRVPGEYVDELQNLSTKLGELKRKYLFLESVYYYDPESNAVITDTYGTYDMEAFYDTQWIKNYNYDLDLQRYDLRINKDQKYLQSQTNRYMFIPTEKVITIVGKGYKSKLLACNISTTKFAGLITDSFGLKEEEYYLLDKEGQILLNNHAEKIGQYVNFLQVDKIDNHAMYYKNKDYYIFYHAIPYNNMLSVMLIPKSLINMNYLYLVNYSLILSIMLMAACIIIAFYVSKKMYSPLENLIISINSFGDFEEAYSKENVKDAVDIFRTVFKSLHGDKVILQNKITVYENSIRNYTFRNYLEEKESLTGLIGTFHELGIQIQNKVYEIVIINIETKNEGGYQRKDQKKEEALNRLNVVDVLDSYICSIAGGLFMDIQKNKYMAFITAGKIDELEVLEENLIDAARNAFGVEMNIGVSNTSEDLEALREIYQQAIKSSKYASFFCVCSGSVYYKNIQPVDIESIPYPINAEIGILKNIIFINQEQADACVKEIIDYIKRINDADYAIIVLNRLLSVIDKEFPLSSLKNSNPFKCAANINNISEMETFLLDLVKQIIQNMITFQRKESHYCILAKKFMMENASTIENVTDISDYINISYPYLSKLFKEQTGTNVLDYLNMIRIEKSKELLKNTNENLSTIAQKVGYSNSQSFQRFFKKYESITPGDYRKMNQNTNK